MMAQLTVRRLDVDLVRRLKIRAAQKNRSAEAEHRAILESVLRPESAEFWRRAAESRAATQGRRATPSETLIRQDRDRDERARRP
jgi:plasmid stability protein